MTSLCFHDRIFSSKFGGNISLVGMSWQSKCIGRYKNIALKMSLSPGNKSGDSFNFYLQKVSPGGNQTLNRFHKSLINFST